MFKARHTTFHHLAGMIWLTVGSFLMVAGIRYLVAAGVNPEDASFLIHYLSYFGGFEQASCLLVALGLLIGHFKTRFVLHKTVTRLSSKILTLPNPAHAKFVFGVRYFVLVAAMMGIGFLMRFFAVPNDIRGMIDVGVGSALISGSLSFFKLGRALIYDKGSRA